MRKVEMTQHNNKKENSINQKPDSLPTNRSPVSPSPGNHYRKSWEETLGDFGSRLVSRRNAIVDWVKGHITSPVLPASIQRQDTTRLNQQIKAKESWSNVIAQRVGALSQAISKARQGRNFLYEPTEFAWFDPDPETANRSRFIENDAIHHADSASIGNRQQKERKLYTEYSPTFHKEPLITLSQQKEQHKAIVHSEPTTTSEHNPVFTGEPYLTQVPAQFKATIDSQITDSTRDLQRLSPHGSELTYPLKEFSRNTQEEDIQSTSSKETNPVFHTHLEEISTPIKSVITESETPPNDTSTHHHPAPITDTSHTQEIIPAPTSSIEKPALIHKQPPESALSSETIALKKSSEGTIAQPVPDTKVISSPTVSVPAEKRLPDTIIEKYQPDTILSHHPAVDPVSPIQPVFRARSYMTPIQREPKLPSIPTDFTDGITGKANKILPAKSLLPADQKQHLASMQFFDNNLIQRTAEVHGSKIETTIAPVFEHLATRSSETDTEILRKSSGDISLPSYQPPHNIISSSHTPAYERTELFLATPDGIPRKDISSQDIALAPAARSAAGNTSSESTESTANKASQNEGTDTEALAREVYTIIKRRLSIERERVICA